MFHHLQRDVNVVPFLTTDGVAADLTVLKKKINLHMTIKIVSIVIMIIRNNEIIASTLMEGNMITVIKHRQTDRQTADFHIEKI